MQCFYEPVVIYRRILQSAVANSNLIGIAIPPLVAANETSDAIFLFDYSVFIERGLIPLQRLSPAFNGLLKLPRYVCAFTLPLIPKSSNENGVIYICVQKEVEPASGAYSGSQKEQIYTNRELELRRWIELIRWKPPFDKFNN